MPGKSCYDKCIERKTTCQITACGITDSLKQQAFFFLCSLNIVQEKIKNHEFYMKGATKGRGCNLLVSIVAGSKEPGTPESAGGLADTGGSDERSQQ